MRRTKPALRTPARAPDPSPAAVALPALGWQLPSGFALICLVFYGVTLSTSVNGGDSGELIATSYTWSVPHPPGYPLYTLLAHLFTGLPWGSVAWRVNALSALCNALAATLLLLTLRRLTRSTLAGVLGGGLFASFELSWRYAIVADVFALNNACIAALMYLSGRLLQRWSWRLAAGFAFWVGLALSNQQTSLFMGPPVLLCLLYHGWRVTAATSALSWRQRWGSGALLLLALLLGLTPYLLLRSLQVDNVLSWGATQSWQGLLTHVLRREYGTWHLSGGGGAGAGPFWALWGLFASNFVAGCGWLAPALLSGLLWRTPTGQPPHERLALRRWQRLWCGAALFYGLIFFRLADLSLDVPVHREMQSRFWLQLALVGCAMVALGGWRWAQRLHLSRARQGLAVALLLSLPVGWHAGSLARLSGVWAAPSRALLIQQFAQSMLAALPPHALLLSRGEHVFNPLRYVQSCLGQRPDVMILSVEMMHAAWYRAKVLAAYPRLRYPGTMLNEAPGASGSPGPSGLDTALQSTAPAPFTLERFLQANLAAGTPIFQCDHNPIVPAALRNTLQVLPAGLCQEVLLPQATRSQALRRLAAPLVDLGRHLQHAYPSQSWEAVVLAQINHSKQSSAAQLLLELPEPLTAAAVNNLQLSIQLLNALQQDVAGDTAADAQPAAAILKNLGIAYARLNAYTPQPSHAAHMLSAFRAWLRTPAAASDVDQAKIQAWVGHMASTVDDAPPPTP